MPSVGQIGNRFVGYKNEEFDPMLDEIEELQDNFNDSILSEPII